MFPGRSKNTCACLVYGNVGLKKWAVFRKACARNWPLPALCFTNLKSYSLDEPTAVLDPEAAKLVRDFIEELKVEGRTIFLCTHNLDEADRLCQRIAIFKTHLITVDFARGATHPPVRTPGRFPHRRDCSQPGLKRSAAWHFVKEAKSVDNKLLVRLNDPETQNPVIIREFWFDRCGAEFNSSASCATAGKIIPSAYPPIAGKNGQNSINQSTNKAHEAESIQKPPRVIYGRGMMPFDFHHSYPWLSSKLPLDNRRRAAVDHCSVASTRPAAWRTAADCI